jgi:hypothetical protein
MRWVYFVWIGVVVIFMGLGQTTLSLTAQSSTVSGIVVDESGPVTGAHVRVRATENSTITDANGQFTLEALDTGQEIEITSWAPGYYIAYTNVVLPADDVTLTLRRYHTEDNENYQWGSPHSDADSSGCDECHPMIIEQWENNAHGGAIHNIRFYSLYNGTDISGNTQIDPGYLLDFPDTNGICAQCHAPAAGIDNYLTVNMNDVRGDVTSGIFCDYCHKIGAVYLNPATQMPYPNAPGIQSQLILRPPEGDDIFFGPYDDIHDPDTYLPEISESSYCAPCHQFSMWGTPIYESYGEWLNSPYADNEITCQNCHMPPTGDTMFATVAAGALEHPPESIPSHLQLGAADVELLQNTVTMTVEAQQDDAIINITVNIENTGAGHHVPTDFPGRHMILVLSVVDENGQSLPLISGPIIPQWGGPQAGYPGKAYAKVLRDVATGEMPVVSYWNQTQIVSDNRIAAFETDTSTYSYSIESSYAGEISINATLFLRRVFYDEGRARDWDMPDIKMEEINTQFSTE